MYFLDEENMFAESDDETNKPGPSRYVQTEPGDAMEEIYMHWNNMKF